MFNPQKLFECNPRSHSPPGFQNLGLPDKLLGFGCGHHLLGQLLGNLCFLQLAKPSPQITVECLKHKLRRATNLKAKHESDLDRLGFWQHKWLEGVDLAAHVSPAKLWKSFRAFRAGTPSCFPRGFLRSLG